MTYAGWRSEVEMLKFEYDFAKDAGAVGSISLRASNGGANSLPDNFVVQAVHVVVETTITSGGTPTLTIGEGVDADGFALNFFGTPTAGAFVAGAGALIPSIMSADRNVVLAIGTAALTAGKFSVYVMGYQAR